jgi:hypothetical protein
MLRNKWFLAAFAFVALVGVSVPLSVAADGGHRKLEVTVTNITRGQVLSPPVVVVHSPSLSPLFVVGEPASPELAMVAEDADSAALVAKLSSSHGVRAVVVGGEPIPPGGSLTVEIDAGRPYDRISVVGMLVTTNDAFYGLDGGATPGRGTRVYEVPAYDAGSERNSELCEFIPGPPCGKDHVRDTTGAEGFVHIHAGIHGLGSLLAEDFDWRNPVAKVQVRR